MGLPVSRGESQIERGIRIFGSQARGLVTGVFTSQTHGTGSALEIYSSHRWTIGIYTRPRAVPSLVLVTNRPRSPPPSPSTAEKDCTPSKSFHNEVLLSHRRRRSDGVRRLCCTCLAIYVSGPMLTTSARRHAHNCPNHRRHEKRATTPGVTPTTFTNTLKPGDHATVSKTVTVPTVLPKPDIYFLADTTGSMGSAIANVKANAADILNQIRAATSDSRYGAGEYKDFDSGDPFAYHNDAAIPGSDDGGAAALAAINAWSASGGGDTPEANLYALHKLVTQAGFRSDSSRIVVWFGDAPGHDPICSSVSGEATDITEASVIADLQAANIKVIAVSVSDGSPGLNGNPAGSYPGCPGGGSSGQATRITAATGGQLFSNVPPSEIANAILAGLTSLPVTVKPVATCDTGLSATFDATEKTVASGADATFTETLTLGSGVASTTALQCTVDFMLNGVSGGAAFVEKDTITPIINQPPVCTSVTATPSALWPPNHKFVTVGLTGASDPDGDSVTYVITGVTQDEPINGTGDGDTAPDAAWVSGTGRDKVQLRAERSGTGDGRVYRISYTVSDGKGGSCSGIAYVGVPHDQGNGPAVDTTSVVVNSFGS